MIRIHVVRKNDFIKQISLSGHADYEVYGKDIVCAAVSATFLCTVNGILSINKDAIEITSREDMQIINVLNNNDIVQKLLHNMLRCLESLEKQYPNNIEINLDKEEETWFNF